jgi:release factor glutamine methyltransferase
MEFNSNGLTLAQIKLKIESFLSKAYDKEEASSLTKWVLEEILELAPNQWVSIRNELFPQSKEVQLKKAIHALLDHYPIQYFFNKAHFYGRDFFVNEAVLIPRQETEDLCRLIIENRALKKILEIGTGSGCIPITLDLEIPNAELTSIEISPEALSIAKRNAKYHDSSINFLREDVFSFESKERFDAIVGNPPYITLSESPSVGTNVFRNEPHLALFVPNDDPLIFYRRIAKLGKKILVKGGQIILEINPIYAHQLTNLFLEEQYDSIHIRQDLFGKDRFILAALD